jgi:hypothetical protein
MYTSREVFVPWVQIYKSRSVTIKFALIREGRRHPIAPIFITCYLEVTGKTGVYINMSMQYYILLLGFNCLQIFDEKFRKYLANSLLWLISMGSVASPLLRLDEYAVYVKYACLFLFMASIIMIISSSTYVFKFYFYAFWYQVTLYKNKMEMQCVWIPHPSYSPWRSTLGCFSYE